MAVDMGITNAAARTIVDTVVDLLDVGAPGTIDILDGTQPVNVDAALTTQTVLATLTLATPAAFGAAADVGGSATATANTITSDTSADATGTATWFRAMDGVGNGVIDGTVGTSAADLILDSVSIVAGGIVAITAWTVTQPES